MHARMRAFELRQQQRDNLAFAADGPEFQARFTRFALTSAERDGEHDAGAPQHGAPAPAHCAVPLSPPEFSSQPPLNPARFRPRRTYGFLRITFHTNSSR